MNTLLVCLGWLERPKTYATHAECLKRRGKETIVPDTARSGTVRSVFSATYSGVEPVELRKASMAFAALGERHEKIDVVAHSEGALFALPLVLSEPQKVRALVLVDPAGCVGNMEMRSLIGRFMREIFLHSSALAREAEGKEPFHKDQFERGTVEIFEGLVTFLRFPLETLRSIRAIARADIRGMLREARMRGVRIVVLHGTEDRVFPNETMKKEIGALVDSFIEVPGSHVWYLLEPGRYARLIADVL